MKLNCDLGEGEPAARGRALLACVDAANVACGGHAGNLRTMEQCVRWCREFGVLLGAHPGPWSRIDGGRNKVDITLGQFELLLIQQVSALEKVARYHGARLHHIKLHGALYHASESDAGLARAYLHALTKWWPNLKVIAFAGGVVARLAHRKGLPVWEEAFVDRAYQDDGSLVPRGSANALLGVNQAVAQARGLIEQEVVQTSGGKQRIVRAGTLCVHSDTPGAVQIARAVKVLCQGRRFH